MLITLFTQDVYLYIGDSIMGVDKIPVWNELCEDHVKFSLLVASTVMDDIGWILVLCRLSSIALVEHMASRAGLVVGLIWVLNCSEPYGTSSKYSHVFKVHALLSMGISFY